MQTALATLRDNKTATTIVLAHTEKAKLGIITEVTPTRVTLEGASGTVHHINPAYIVEFYETPDTVGGRVYSAANRTIPGRNR